MATSKYLALRDLRLVPGQSNKVSPRGSIVELTDAKAKSLINLVRPMDQILSVDTAEDKIKEIALAMETVDFDEPDLLTASGRPKVEVMEGLTELALSAAEVDQAFIVYKSSNPDVDEED